MLLRKIKGKRVLLVNSPTMKRWIGCVHWYHLWYLATCIFLLLNPTFTSQNEMINTSIWTANVYQVLTLLDTIFFCGNHFCSFALMSDEICNFIRLVESSITCYDIWQAIVLNVATWGSKIDTQKSGHLIFYNNEFTLDASQTFFDSTTSK